MTARSSFGPNPGSSKTAEALAIREMSAEAWKGGSCTQAMGKLSRSGRDSGAIMVGALVKVSNMISFDALIRNLAAILGEGKAKLIKQNQQALELGFSYIKE